MNEEVSTCSVFSIPISFFSDLTSSVAHKFFPFIFIGLDSAVLHDTSGLT